MTNAEFHSVFDCDEESVRLAPLRRQAVIDDVCFLRREYGPQFKSINGNGLRDADFALMHERHRTLNHVGRFSGSRTLSNELIWKWTEATGKYVGCQFWSIEAKSLFDAEVEVCGGWPITSKVKKTIEAKLQGKGPVPDRKLTHEHVYPIKDMKILLSNLESPDAARVLEHFDRQCVSCVVLESEHKKVMKARGVDGNPWHRYRDAQILLAENPAWPQMQRALISAAGLVSQG
jgi:hypothetical protein